MSEWRYECPRCKGKYREWDKNGDTWKCPFCALEMGKFVGEHLVPLVPVGGNLDCEQKEGSDDGIDTPEE